MERLRFAGPNERRCIVRQALGFYRTLVVGGVYSSNKLSKPYTKAAFTQALRHCISVHPILSATIVREETEAPEFVKVPKLDLNNHVEYLDRQQLFNGRSIPNEQDLLKPTLQRTHDSCFTSCDEIPPWRIVVVPLLDQNGKAESKVLILFAYYHSHGDGKSGLAFHKSFIEGLRLDTDANHCNNLGTTVNTSSKPLLPNMEQAAKLTISWPYLLSPLLGAYLPRFLSASLNLRASATPESQDQWRGQRTCHDPISFRTGVEMLIFDNDKVQKVLSRCRSQRTKFTGLLHQLIVRALSETVPAETPAGSFVSQTAVDLQKQLNGPTDDDMALCPTGYYELFPRDANPNAWADWTATGSDSPIWDAARSTTEGLAKCANTLHDQPVGLLRYLSNFYSSTLGQIGKLRDTSYELSNIMYFDPPAPQIEEEWDIESMVFSQPANAVGSCLSFNVVSRK